MKKEIRKKADQNIYLPEENWWGQRLDKWLADKLTIARSLARQLVLEKAVLLNEQNAKPHALLREGDRLEIVRKNVLSDLTAIKGKKGKKSKKEKDEEEKKREQEIEDFNIEIIAKTKDYLVVNKPAGLLTHPAPSSAAPSLTTWLLKKYPQVSSVGEDLNRPGIVHRLDKDASGLLVVALNNNFFNHLKEQFKKRQVKKIYQALVYDAALPDEFEVNFLIERSSDGSKMAAKPLSQTGRTATTKVKVIKKFYNYALLEVTIATGRTHQIRVHLSAYTHPIVGDNIYGQVKHKKMNLKFGLKRIFLVATKLSFEDLAGKKVNFSIELPNELTEFLKIIK